MRAGRNHIPEIYSTGLALNRSCFRSVQIKTKVSMEKPDQSSLLLFCTMIRNHLQIQKTLLKNTIVAQVINNGIIRQSNYLS